MNRKIEQPSGIHPAPKRQKLRTVSTVGSVVICGVISLCLLIQPDWLTPVILVPAWCWIIPGLTLALIGFRAEHKRAIVAVLLMWGVFGFLFVEEARSLPRGWLTPNADWQAVQESRRGLRVVSLNCNVGQVASVEEVAAYEADVVLLQESPGQEQLPLLAQSLFGSEGSFLYGGDVSILAHGELRPKFSNSDSHFIHAEIELSSGVLVDVVSTRLAPPVPRIDFWSNGFWSDHRNRRIDHREQIQEIVQHLQHVPSERHLVVGGDFNALPNDDALTPLQSRVSDTFLAAGSGWGATGTNEYPLFRVDQIWTSSELHPALVVAQKTQHSDHRMVVCDLLILE